MNKIKKKNKTIEWNNGNNNKYSSKNNFNFGVSHFVALLVADDDDEDDDDSLINGRELVWGSLFWLVSC